MKWSMSGIISDTEEDELTGERAGAEQGLTEEVKIVVWRGSNRSLWKAMSGRKKGNWPSPARL